MKRHVVKIQTFFTICIFNYIIFMFIYNGRQSNADTKPWTFVFQLAVMIGAFFNYTPQSYRENSTQCKTVESIARDCCCSTGFHSRFLIYSHFGSIENLLFEPTFWWAVKNQPEMPMFTFRQHRIALSIFWVNVN